MKFKNYLTIALITILLSLMINALYDAYIITPAINSIKFKVVDVDYILNKSEKEVKNGNLSMETYKKRVAEAERIVKEYPYTLVNQYINIDGKYYPIIFGGDDVTEDILKRIEEIK